MSCGCLEAVLAVQGHVQALAEVGYDEGRVLIVADATRGAVGENVVGLHVPVHDAVGVEVRETLRHLQPAHRPRRRRVQRRAAAAPAAPRAPPPRAELRLQRLPQHREYDPERARRRELPVDLHAAREVPRQLRREHAEAGGHVEGCERVAAVRARRVDARAGQQQIKVATVSAHMNF